MKKYKWLIVLGIIIIALIIISIVFSDNESKYITEINISKVIEKIDKKDSFILYINQTNCEHCRAFKPKFISALKDSKLKAYSLNLSNLSEDDEDIYDENFDITGTPTVLFYDEGNLSLIKIEGEQTKEKIISKFEASGFLKEK